MQGEDGAGERTGDNKNGRRSGFEIMANVVWDEVGTAIVDRLGWVVFAAGKSGGFRTVRFLAIPSIARDLTAATLPK